MGAAVGRAGDLRGIFHSEAAALTDDEQEIVREIEYKATASTDLDG
jgi:hypothetical protein